MVRVLARHARSHWFKSSIAHFPLFSLDIPSNMTLPFKKSWQFLYFRKTSFVFEVIFTRRKLQMKKFIYLWFIVSFTLPFIMGATCSHHVRCKLSNDCKNAMICGAQGYCVPQCKTTRDCLQDQRCIEGKCKDFK